MKIQPTLEEFKEKSRSGNLVPVWGEVLGDMETPVSAFKKFEHHEYAFLLESVEHGDRIGRYSFIGFNPPVVIRSRGREVIIAQGGNDEEVISDCANPMAFMRDFMKRYEPVPEPKLPPFVGGAVGYTSYDLVRSFEKLPDKNRDELKLPDCIFMIADSLLAFDHVRRKILLIHNAHVSDSPETAYREAVHKIEVMAERLKGHPIAHSEKPLVNASRGKRGDEIASNMTRDEFKHAVESAKQYILAGDAFQIVLSQRFSRAYGGDPFDVYRALRAVNPSPYMFYLKYGDMKLAGSSPEILVTVTDGEVCVRPIAGTRKRSDDAEEDRRLEKELLNDPKERAEHIMLVDLGRNDVGRVSEPGSVRVSDLMTIERYSHVMHIVSNVRGKLKKGCDGFDAFEATFPAGTLSGAPKIRAMEIIDELENLRRGTYGGACGYFGFNGNLDTCITIRTVLLKDGMAYVQAGAGLVADSDPEAEYQETVNKAQGMFTAIEMAEAGLD